MLIKLTTFVIRRRDSMNIVIGTEVRILFLRLSPCRLVNFGFERSNLWKFIKERKLQIFGRKGGLLVFIYTEIHTLMLIITIHLYPLRNHKCSC